MKVYVRWDTWYVPTTILDDNPQKDCREMDLPPELIEKFRRTFNAFDAALNEVLAYDKVNIDGVPIGKCWDEDGRMTEIPKSETFEWLK